MLKKERKNDMADMVEIVTDMACNDCGEVKEKA
jgi:hypothetical protein